MEKTPHRILKGVQGLDAGEKPAAFADQQRQVKQSAKLADSLLAASTETGRVVLPYPVKATQRVKLVCKTVNFTLNLPVYAVDVQESCINLQVDPEFSLSGDKLEFVLETEGKVYPVMFLGLTVDFPNCHAIVFVKIPEANR